MSQENVELVRRWFELSGQGDHQAALRYVDPKIEIHEGVELPGAGSYVGHAGLATAYPHWASQWAELRIDLEEMIDAGDAVVAVTRHHGTGRASGVAVHDVVAYVVKVEGGKVVRLSIFNTKLQALEAVGLSE